MIKTNESELFEHFFLESKCSEFTSATYFFLPIKIISGLRHISMLHHSDFFLEAHYALNRHTAL